MMVRAAPDREDGGTWWTWSGLGGLGENLECEFHRFRRLVWKGKLPAVGLTGVKADLLARTAKLTPGCGRTPPVFCCLYHFFAPRHPGPWQMFGSILQQK